MGREARENERRRRSLLDENDVYAAGLRLRWEQYGTSALLTGQIDASKDGVYVGLGVGEPRRHVPGDRPLTPHEMADLWQANQRCLQSLAEAHRARELEERRASAVRGELS